MIVNIQLLFTKASKGNGSRLYGTLKWIDVEYKCITGGYGLGPIPDGLFEVRVRHAVEGKKNNMKSGYVNPLNNRGWFLPLNPKFSTSRTGFGIHPDGNLPGTKGCIGLLGGDTQKFWDRWIGTALSMRPTSLLVSASL